MDFSFLAAANGITSTYLNQNSVTNSISDLNGLDEETRKKLGAEFTEAYDSMMATKALNTSMRQSYSNAHQDDFRVHADRLGYSIDTRVIDMLHLQLSDEMNNKVNDAINNAMNNL